MPTINANTSTQVALPAGQDISGTGAGSALVGNGAAGAIPLTNGSPWQIGPFLTAQTVHITASSAITYSIEEPLTVPSAADRLPASTVAATQALVLGGGIGSPMLVFNFGQDRSVNSDNTATDAAGRIIPNYSFVIPAGSMGPNGRLRFRYIGSNSSPAASGQDGTISLRIGATRIAPFLTFTVAASQTRLSENNGSWDNTSNTANRFFDSNSKSVPVISSGMTVTAIDTTVDQTVDVIGAWAGANAGSVITMRSLTAWAEYGA